MRSCRRRRRHWGRGAPHTCRPKAAEWHSFVHPATHRSTFAGVPPRRESMHSRQPAALGTLVGTPASSPLMTRSSHSMPESRDSISAINQHGIKISTHPPMSGQLSARSTSASWPPFMCGAFHHQRWMLWPVETTRPSTLLATATTHCSSFILNNNNIDFDLADPSPPALPTASTRSTYSGPFTANESPFHLMMYGLDFTGPQTAVADAARRLDELYNANDPDPKLLPRHYLLICPANVHQRSNAAVPPRHHGPCLHQHHWAHLRLWYSRPHRRSPCCPPRRWP